MNQRQLKFIAINLISFIMYSIRKKKSKITNSKSKQIFKNLILEILLIPVFGFSTISLVFASTLPDSCGRAGKLAIGTIDRKIHIPDQELDGTQNVTVTTDSNLENGDLSDVNALINSPGHDGISLREAIKATNNDHGRYKISFHSGLKGSTIDTGSSKLPPLVGGNVIVNGDIDGDNKPDITIQGSNKSFRGFNVASSGNTLNALSILNYTIAVSLAANSSSNKIFANNTIKNLDIRDTENGIILSSFSKYPDVAISNETWKNIYFIGNSVETSKSGIVVSTAYSTNAYIEEIVIANNTVNITAENNAGNGIHVSNGFGKGSQNNNINDIHIADNNITGNLVTGIEITAGFGGKDSGGAGNNTIKRISIHGNKLRLNKSQFAIAIGSGFWDGSDSNRISEVKITGNYISGSAEPTAINVSAGAVGADRNSINDIRIIANDLELTPTKDALFGICAIVGDAGTDWSDPNYRPIGYPEYNKISDVQILDNYIDGVGSSGIFVSLGCLGARYNEIQEVYLIGNEIKNIGYAALPVSGINISGSNDLSEVERLAPLENKMTDIFVQANSISSGGIKIRGGNLGATNDELKRLLVSHNDIDSGELIGIDVVGGWGHSDEVPLNNTVSEVEIFCNLVDSTPKKYGEPELKGISIMGGRQWSSNNKIDQICLYNNLVAGELNDIFVKNNSKYASAPDSVVSNNVVNLVECKDRYNFINESPLINIEEKNNIKTISSSNIDKINLNFSLLPLHFLNQDAEYWLIMFTSGDTYYCLNKNIIWEKKIASFFNYPLLNIYNLPIPTPPLKEGTNTIYFAVDLTPDGDLKNDRIWYDSIVVNVK